MKLDIIEVTAKALCYVVIGAGANLATSLSQWANSGEWPDRINWVVIITSCSVGGATNLLSFLSNSYAGFKQGRTNGSADKGNTDFFRNPLPQPPAGAVQQPTAAATQTTKP